MKSVDKVLHAVAGVTFVVSVNDFGDDKTVVKCMLTKDNKQICYLDFFSNTMRIVYVKVIT